MAEFGLLGEHLSHSISPRLHRALGGYEYALFPVAPEKLGEFLETTPCRGLNVTIPYKKAVIPYCARLSPNAERLGSVNTLVRRADGWYGDNTDYAGFCQTARRFEVKGAHALVLGSGGAGVMAAAALRDLGAGRVDVVSRTGEIDYVNLDRHADLIVNATPVGMYPENGQAPIDLREFPDCRGVIDLIYNPLRTKLLLDAEALRIPYANGLAMLVAQAAEACRVFTGRGSENAEKVLALAQKEQENIVLLGMPGCGKTTVGKLAAVQLGRPFYDCDEELTKRCGPIPRIFEEQGEAAFRAMETEILRELGKKTGAVIALGGGAVTREENYPLLRQNGTLIWLRRPLEALPIEGRPLSQKYSAQALYSAREPRYRAWAEHIVDNFGTAEEAAAAVLEVFR